jgi:sulfatase modifying factor 1
MHGRAFAKGAGRLILGAAIATGGCKDDPAPGLPSAEPALEPIRTVETAPRPAPSPKASAPPTPAFRDGAGCGRNMARIGAFCIDRYEVELVDRASGRPHPYFVHPPDSASSLAAVSRPGVFPQGYMSQEGARAACEAAGKRLCTLAEWQAACGGARKARYPYGEEYEEGRCNVNRIGRHILDKYFPDIPHLKRAGKEFNDPRLLIDPDYLEWTGQSASCVTPDGLFDMDGNLSEWVSETVEKPDGLHGTFAGNAFIGYASSGCGRWTDAHAAAYHDYSLGTRCCATPRGR